MTRRNVQHNVAQHLARFRPSSVEEEEEEEDFTSWKDYLWITPQLTLDDYGF